MERVNVTLIVNMQAEAENVDEVSRFLMRAGVQCATEQDTSKGQVTSLNVLEGLSLNVEFVPSQSSGSGSDIMPSRPTTVWMFDEVTRRFAASPHGPLPIPTSGELDRADAGEYDGFVGLVPKPK